MSISPETDPSKPADSAQPEQASSDAQKPASRDASPHHGKDARDARDARSPSRPRSRSSRDSGSYRDSRGGPVDGTIHIAATFNNTLSTFVDNQDNTQAWANAGEENRGAKRSTPYAASGVAKRLVQRVKDKNLRISRVNIVVKGAGRGSIDAFLKEIHRHFEICSIEDRTPLPHNGCRPPKKRRV